MGFLSSVLDFLFPPKCMFCHKVLPVGQRGCCSSCGQKLIQKLPPRQGVHFKACYAPMLYEGTAREALIQFKFHDRPGYATELGKILADCIRENLSGQYDIITWVPVSEKRLKKRGYDQAMLLAMAAALALDDVAVETLKKCKDTPAQSSLEGADQRRTNVADVYKIVDPELIAGQRVLLIDDIITTGATLEEASRTLKQAGATSVVAAAVAKTVYKNKHTEEEAL